MEPIRQVPILLSMPSGEQATAVLPVRSVSREDRWPRAYKPALQLFAAGLLLAPVPLMHIVGPLVMWSLAGALLVRRLSQTSRILQATLQCPKCGGSVDVAEQGEHWPLVTACNDCRWQVQASLRSLGPESGAPPQPV